MKNRKKICIIFLFITIILSVMIGCNNSDQNSSKIQNSSEILNKDSDEFKSINLSKSLFQKGYYDYEGTINNTLKIKMSLYKLSGEIVGTYSYESGEEEVKLKGKSDNKKIMLFQYNESGEIVAVFQGDMVSIDKIQGVWSNGKNKLPFILSLVNTTLDVEYGQR